MYRISFFAFWVTLILYLTTLFTASYVGVYLSYIAIPIIVIFGVAMKLSKPNKKYQKAIETSKNAINQASMAATHVASKSSYLLCQLANSLEKGSEEFAKKMEEFNVEQKSRAPFTEAKTKAKELKNIAELGSTIVPDSYNYTHQTIRLFMENMEIIINLMEATIDHPKQRNCISLLMADCQKGFEKECGHLSNLLNGAMKEMYELGLPRNSSMSDRIRFILTQYPKTEIEKIASECLPKAKQGLHNIQAGRTLLQEKGFATY